MVVEQTPLPSEIPSQRSILVLGVTGSGKSSFIKAATGQDIAIGHGGKACTQDVVIYPVSGSTASTGIVLIDTPGFDDPDNNEYDILKMIVKCTEDRSIPPIAGVIYLHRITDTRLTGSSRLNLEILKAMCGERFYRNIVICTTMWDSTPRDARGPYQIVAHHARILTLLQSPSAFQDLMERQATYMEFWGDKVDPCADILRHFAALGKAPKLAIQEQARKNSDLRNTHAGVVIEDEHKRRRKDKRAHHTSQQYPDSVHQGATSPRSGERKHSRDSDDRKSRSNWLSFRR
ncbi:unnamed protein product [Discula destructiva]